MVAARKGHARVTQFPREVGAEKDLRDSHGRTALMMATGGLLVEASDIRDAEAREITAAAATVSTWHPSPSSYHGPTKSSCSSASSEGPDGPAASRCAELFC